MLELKNVSGGYGKRPVIRDISVSFPSGEITSIIGANGCGKSTLLMMCAGLLPHTLGQVLLDGTEISQIPRNAAAKRISYLEQVKSGGSITVRSLVGHGRFPYLGYPRRYSPEDNRKIDEALELAGISELADKTLSELSGGQQQRAHIAMTLAQDTDIILLDEPLTYLDISHQLHIMQLIVQLKDMGKTIIAVMHGLNLALTYSGKIAVMKDGEILVFGSPQEIAGGEEISSALGVRVMYSKEAGQYFFES